MHPQADRDGRTAQLARVRELLARPDTVVFVGSGVSMWSGLPSWEGLLLELAEFLDALGQSSVLVRREIERGDLLQAASFGFMDLAKSDREQFVRQACRVGDAKPSELHEQIVALGPRSFITTNYDKLLERALVAQQVDTGQFRVVTTTNLIGVASIIGAQASEFVFKPHGDVDDSESVVLTREDYRALRGPRRGIFEGLRTLLASRPVVFFGFGLRDPDFLLLQDALAEAFGGAAQDHYAFMPNVLEGEARYWRSNFGLHLVSYELDASPGAPMGGHAALLEVALELAGPSIDESAPDSDDPAQTLSLLRHAGALRNLTSGVPELIPVRGQAREWRAEASRLFAHLPAVPALKATRGRLLLIGPPGAGKSVVTRAAVAELATALMEAALGEALDLDARVPVYIDLKRYDGDLWALVADSLPFDIEFGRLLSTREVYCVLDGVNEIAHDLLEDNTFNDDLETFLSRTAGATIVITSRFATGLESLDVPIVDLEHIDRSWIEDRLSRAGLTPAAVSDAMMSVLSRPLYFRLFEREGWGLDELRSPHTAYSRLIARLSHDARGQFGQVLDLMSAFANIAFARIDAGQQVMELDAVVSEVSRAANAVDVDARAIVDWLVSEEILVAAPGDRVLFFHHSITEYLAAYELACRYRADREVLRACLRRRQWDHAILLTLGFLEPGERDDLLSTILAADAVIGVRALAFLDEASEWKTSVLERLAVLDLSEFHIEHNIAGALDGVVFDASDEDALWSVARRSDVVGRGALEAILRACGEGAVPKVLDRVFEPDTDFNFLNSMDVSKYLDDAALGDLVDRLANVSEEVSRDDPQSSSHRIGLREFVANNLPPGFLPALRERWPDLSSAPMLVRDAAVEYAREDPSDDAFGLLVEFVLGGHPGSAYALYSKLHFKDVTNAQLNLIEDRLLLGQRLLEHSEQDDVEEGGWAAGALLELCSRDEGFRSWVLEQASERPVGLTQAALWFAAGEESRYFEILATLAAGGAEAFAGSPIEIIRECDADWRGHEPLLADLIRLEIPKLVEVLVDTVHLGLVDERFLRFDPRAVELGDLQWCLGFLTELTCVEGVSCYRFGQFWAKVIGSDLRTELLAQFPDLDDQPRQAVADYVLPHLEGLSLDELGCEAVRKLEGDLHERRTTSIPFRGGVLGTIATETYVEEVIVPALETAEPGIYRDNLVAIATSAGARHGVRYVSTNGEPLA